jgi:DNA-binding transcriptional MerR regulator
MELLTLAAVAERLRLPESTVRYHAKKFSQFIPTSGDGRQRRYRPEAVEILRTVAEMLKHNQTATEVMEYLQRNYPINMRVDSEGELSATTKPQPTATKQQQPDLPVNLRDFLEMHMEMVKQSVDKDRLIIDQQKEINRLKEEVKLLRIPPLPWWKKWFRK